MEQLLAKLEQYLRDNGGSVDYADFLSQIDSGNRTEVVKFARKRFNFALSVVDGQAQHTVSLKES